MRKKYLYSTVGVCCKKMEVTLDEDNYIITVNFTGGCPGNLNALKKLIEGHLYTDYLGMFAENMCGNRPNSCMMSFNNMLELIDKDVKGIENYPYEKESF